MDLNDPKAKKFLMWFIVIDTLVTVAILAAFFTWSKKNETAPPPHQTGVEPTPPSPPSVATNETRPVEGGVPQATLLNAPGNTPEQDVEAMNQLVKLFLSVVKEPYRSPLGDNEDVARAMRGDNRMKKVFVPDNHPAFNEQGQLIDRWGTPYFFHPVSADFIEVRSAGPDKKLFTEDDIKS